MKLFNTFDTRPKYILHLILIVLTLFIGYYLGNLFINFSDANVYLLGIKSGLIKMFVWFFFVLWFADGIWEKYLKV